MNAFPEYRIRAVVIFTLGFGLLMFALEHSSRPPDPDAQTPVIKPDYPRHLIDFSLIDQSGHAFTRKDLDGKIVVVNFIFTSCAAVCPYVNAQMERIQQLTAGQPDVKLVSLTMDPVDDTAPVLARIWPELRAGCQSLVLSHWRRDRNAPFCRHEFSPSRHDGRVCLYARKLRPHPAHRSG